MPTLDRDGDVFVLDLGEGDLRFDPDSLDQIEAALGEVAAAEGSRALVTTASGKIWHNGLDLDYLGGQDGDGMVAYIGRIHGLIATMLELPVPTVAAVQGHCFAAGFMFAIAHDERIMRADRGYACLPEIDLGMTFGHGMTAIVDAKLPQPVKHTMVTTGARLGGPEALAAGVVDAVADLDDVAPRAIERARDLAPKAGATLAGIRRNFYGSVIDACRS